MNKSTALSIIENIDWDKYSTPSEYSPKQVKKTFINLISIEKISDYPDICHEVQSSIGNDHSGTYYPIVFEIIDFLIEVEANFENEFVRKTTNAILNNLCYFEIDYGNLNYEDLGPLINKTKSKLDKYKD